MVKKIKIALVGFLLVFLLGGLDCGYSYTTPVSAAVSATAAGTNSILADELPGELVDGNVGSNLCFVQAAQQPANPIGLLLIFVALAALLIAGTRIRKAARIC